MSLFLFHIKDGVASVEGGVYDLAEAEYDVSEEVH